MSVISPHAILGPEWLRQFYGHVGLFGSFCRKNLHAHKTPRFRWGYLGLFWGGVPFYFYGRKDLSVKIQNFSRQLDAAVVPPFLLLCFSQCPPNTRVTWEMADDMIKNGFFWGGGTTGPVPSKWGFENDFSNFSFRGPTPQRNNKTPTCKQTSPYFQPVWNWTGSVVPLRV